MSSEPKPSSSFRIDLDALLRSKYPRIPRWVVRLVGKLLHIDYFNAYFEKGYEGMEFMDKALEYIGVKITVSGLENLRPDGRYTIACNHPLGGADAVGMVQVMGNFFGGKVKVPVNDFLMAMKGAASFFIPVNKVGGQSRSLPAAIREAYDSDAQMCIFPAGKCSRKIKGKIQDCEWGKSFISKSVESGREIVPCHFSGRNSWRFYFLDRIGKIFRMKFPLAMILIPDELYRSRGKEYHLTVGNPIAPTYFDNTKTPAEWAAHVRSLSYDLE